MRPGLICLTLLPGMIVGCGEDGAKSIDEQVAAACEQTRDLHNAIGEAANDMAAAEVSATPTERAELAAGALDTMMRIARDATLPIEPVELTIGLARRRDSAVADLEQELNLFRSTWPEIQQDDRRVAITGVFVLGERLMSETEPRITKSTAETLIDAVRSEPGCKNVIQIPRR